MKKLCAYVCMCANLFKHKEKRTFINKDLLSLQLNIIHFFAYFNFISQKCKACKVIASRQ